MKKPTIYLETSVISYYTARLSTNYVVLSHQELTRRWWENHFHEFYPHVSAIVLDEIARGDPSAAAARLWTITGVPLLPVLPECEELAEIYKVELQLPGRAAFDALHIAIATTHEVDFLVTWNCTHIAGAQVRRKLQELNERLGRRTPTICTPEELLNDDDLAALRNI